MRQRARLRQGAKILRQSAKKRELRGKGVSECQVVSKAELRVTWSTIPLFARVVAVWSGGHETHHCHPWYVTSPPLAVGVVIPAMVVPTLAVPFRELGSHLLAPLDGCCFCSSTVIQS